MVADTGGLCRSCQKNVPKQVELRDLIACLRGKDKRYRGIYFDRFCKRQPPVEALPILREAVLQDDHYLVKCAAIAIRKLKGKAREAIPDLLTAAAHVDAMGMPQSYCECLAALIAIDKHHPAIVPLIRQFRRLDNWHPISSSLEALAAIGTVEAVDLMKEIHDQWHPEFSQTQRRIADKVLSEAKARLQA